MSGIYRVTSEGYLEYSPEFFQQCMREYLGEPGLTVTAARFLGEVGVTETTRMKYRGERDRLLGLFHYAVDYTVGGRPLSGAVLAKSKTHYRDLVARLAGVLVEGGIVVPDVEELLGKTELFNTHMKEINVFRMQKTVPAFARVLPAVYGTYVDDRAQQYVVLEEFLANAYVIKDYSDITFWTDPRIELTMRDFARMHAAHYGNYDALVGEGWLGETMNAGRMQALTPLWRAYAEKLRHFVGKLFDQRYLDEHVRWIDTIPEWWRLIDGMRKTLIFNDAQIRNLAVRNPDGDAKLALYDWECASIQLPQRDVVEILSYVINERTGCTEIAGFLDAARMQLAADSGQQVEPQEWLVGCRYALRDFHVNRMACQLSLHVTLKRPDIERVFRASMRILACVEKQLAEMQALPD